MLRLEASPQLRAELGQLARRRSADFPHGRMVGAYRQLIEELVNTHAPARGRQ
jgi:hypothetical protein